MSTTPTLPRHSHKKRLCLCGCGETVTGRKTKLYYSRACAKRAARSGPQPLSTAVAKASSVGENPPQGDKAVAQGGGVAVTDTKQPIYCPCGRGPLPRLFGPIQVPVYCADCVQAERCPCYSRPAWHQFGGTAEKARVA